jgi:hypothetical protein
VALHLPQGSTAFLRSPAAVGGRTPSWQGTTSHEVFRPFSAPSLESLLPGTWFPCRDLADTAALSPPLVPAVQGESLRPGSWPGACPCPRANEPRALPGSEPGSGETARQPTDRCRFSPVVVAVWQGAVARTNAGRPGRSAATASTFAPGGSGCRREPAATPLESDVAHRLANELVGPWSVYQVPRRGVPRPLRSACAVSRDRGGLLLSRPSGVFQPVTLLGFGSSVDDSVQGPRTWRPAGSPPGPYRLRRGPRSPLGGLASGPPLAAQGPWRRRGIGGSVPARARPYAGRFPARRDRCSKLEHGALLPWISGCAAGTSGDLGKAPLRVSARAPGGSAAPRRSDRTASRRCRRRGSVLLLSVYGNLLPAWARLGPLSIEASLSTATIQTVRADLIGTAHPMGWRSGFPTGRPWVFAVPDPVPRIALDSPAVARGLA